jgi:O-antigen/teichoic acid export membrane protein
VQLGVNALYSLASVPLILHWLPKEQFGLWVVLLQLMSFLFLIDLGINQAISRFLVDHKDQRHTGEYGALVKTSFIVSALQGGVVLFVVLAGSPLLAFLMKIPPQYQTLFIDLMRLQGLLAAFVFCLNPLNIMLLAHQRMDIVSRVGICNLLLSLAILAGLLSTGFGVFSFIYASAVTAVVASVQLLYHCNRLGLMPKGEEWGQTGWARFNEVFFYGKDVFMINLGAQLITSSQTVIISRMLGLEAAAAWSVGTKVFMMIRLIVYQPFGAASPGLSEMVVRNEVERLRVRFKSLASLTASLGVFLGVAYALCNSLFVEIWTRGHIVWLPINDVVLAVWFLLSALQVPHCNFVFVTKRVAEMRLVYFAEGCCFVLLSSTVGWRFGIPGIVCCSIACVLLFSCNVGLRLTGKYFNIPITELVFDWCRPAFKLALCFVIPALLLWLATGNFASSWRLAIHLAVVGTIGTVIFIRHGIPQQIVFDSAQRLPRPAAWILSKLVL